MNQIIFEAYQNVIVQRLNKIEYFFKTNCTRKKVFFSTYLILAKDENLKSQCAKNCLVTTDLKTYIY